MIESAPAERRGGRQKGAREAAGTDQKARELEIRQAYERDLGHAPNIVGQAIFARAASLLARFETAASDPATKARDLIALDTAAKDASDQASAVIIHAKQKAKDEAAKAKALATKSAKAAQASNGNGTPITELKMSPRAQRQLAGTGVRTIEELLQLSGEDDLLRFGLDRFELWFSLEDCSHLSASDVLKAFVVCYRPLNWRVAEMQARIESARLREANDLSQLSEEPNGNPELERDRWLDRTTRDLAAERVLSARATNLLRALEIPNYCYIDPIVYVGELVQRTEREMLRVQNLGRRTLNELKEALASLGLHFRMQLDNWRRPAPEKSDAQPEPDLEPVQPEADQPVDNFSGSAPQSLQSFAPASVHEHPFAPLKYRRRME